MGFQTKVRIQTCILSIKQYLLNQYVEKNKAYIGISTYTVKVHYQEDPKNLNKKHIQAAKCHSLILCEV